MTFTSQEQRKAAFASMNNGKVRFTKIDKLGRSEPIRKIKLIPLEQVKIPFSCDDYENKPSEERDRVLKKNRQLVHDWERNAMHEICIGKISQEEAKELGLSFTDARKYEQLPKVMYHTTSNYSGIANGGFKLKTREELGKGVQALGGGTDNTISFTTSFEIADDIRNGLIEISDFLNNKIKLQEFVDNAKNAKDSKVPYWNKIMNYNDAKLSYELLSTGKYRESYFLGGKKLYEVPEDWIPVGEPIGRDNDIYTAFDRPANQNEIEESKVRFYKAYSAFREDSGGRSDPLFWMADAEGLKKIDPKNVAILEIKPKNKDCKGYKTSGMQEWRVNTGDAVKVTGVL